MSKFTIQNWLEESSDALCFTIMVFKKWLCDNFYNPYDENDCAIAPFFEPVGETVTEFSPGLGMTLLFFCTLGIRIKVNCNLWFDGDYTTFSGRTERTYSPIRRIKLVLVTSDEPDEPWTVPYQKPRVLYPQNAEPKIMLTLGNGMELYMSLDDTDDGMLLTYVSQDPFADLDPNAYFECHEYDYQELMEICKETFRHVSSVGTIDTDTTQALEWFHVVKETEFPHPPIPWIPEIQYALLCIQIHFLSDIFSRRLSKTLDLDKGLPDEAKNCLDAYTIVRCQMIHNNLRWFQDPDDIGSIEE